jgi:hypothetical protein
LLGLQGFLLISRNQIEATVLRVPGMLYQEQPGNRISNLYNVQLLNKTTQSMIITLQLENRQEGEIKVVGEKIVVPESSSAEVVCFVELPKSTITAAKTPLQIGIYSNGKLVEKTKTNFLGPVN